MTQKAVTAIKQLADKDLAICLVRSNGSYAASLLGQTMKAYGKTPEVAARILLDDVKKLEQLELRKKIMSV